MLGGFSFLDWMTRGRRAPTGHLGRFIVGSLVMGLVYASPLAESARAWADQPRSSTSSSGSFQQAGFTVLTSSDSPDEIAIAVYSGVAVDAANQPHFLTSVDLLDCNDVGCSLRHPTNISEFSGSNGALSLTLDDNTRGVIQVIWTPVDQPAFLATSDCLVLTFRQSDPHILLHLQLASEPITNLTGTRHATARATVGGVQFRDDTCGVSSLFSLGSYSLSWS